MKYFALLLIAACLNGCAIYRDRGLEQVTLGPLVMDGHWQKEHEIGRGEIEVKV